MRKQIFIAIVVSIFFIGIAPFYSTHDQVYAVDAAVIAENIDNYFIPAFPDLYGEILERNLSEEQLKNTACVTKTLEVLGYIKTLGDIANKIDARDYSDAALDAALTACKAITTYLKDDSTKKVLLGSIGISSAVITGVFITIEITRNSYKAVEESKTALDLERLYYRIESDTTLKTPNRKLGEGDPIRQDKQAVESLWRKVLMDKEFAALMKNYVTTELGQEWPEPTIWEKLTISYVNLQEAKLLEEEKRLKGHIKGLISELNKVAKKREASVILAQQLREITAMAAKISPEELKEAFRAYNKALLALPEVEKYLASFPTIVANLKARFEKANASELINIRDEIIRSQERISSFAKIIRGFPTVGRMANKRTTILTSLKDAGLQLNALYNLIPKSEIDKRLTEESKRITEEAARLDTGGVEFEFKRYECKKTFDEMKSQFYNSVIMGENDAEELIQKAKDEVDKERREIFNNYLKDYDENKKKYDDASTRLNEDISKLQEEISKLQEEISKLQEEISRVNGALRQAKGSALDSLYNQRTNLSNQRDKLIEQKKNLDTRFKKYDQLFWSTFLSDLGECHNTINEIDKFYMANMNRFAIALSSAAEQFKNASDLYSRFMENHNYYNTGPKHFLSASQIAYLKKLVESAPPGYVGFDLKFLKDHIKMDKASPISLGLVATLKEIADALTKYIGAIGSLRMEYNISYETTTLSSLKFMESKEASDAVDNLLTAIDNAIKAHERIEPKNIPVRAKQGFVDSLETLHRYKKEIEGYRQLISLSSGLASTMERYWTRAKTQNAAISEDIAYLGKVWARFEAARTRATGQFAMFQVEAAQWKPDYGTIPPVLTSEKVKEVLEYTDIIGFSKQYQLGIEAFIPDAFIEVKWKGGFIVIRPEDLNTLSGKIQAIPLTDYSAFYKSLHAMREASGPEGFIMECFFVVGKNFWSIFDSNSNLQAAAKKLQETIAKQSDMAEKIYYKQEEENKRKEEQKKAEEQKRKAEAQLTAVKDLYNQFKRAYESKNDALVVSLLSNSWTAQDGSTISDLQANLRRIYRVFDEVRYNIQNLNIVDQGDGRYMVSYNLTITSRQYKKNLKHEESSALNEEVVIDNNGKAKINRTLSGRFWLP